MFDFNNKSMYEAFHQAALKVPNNTAIYYQKKKISFKQLDLLIDKMADVLQNQLRVRKGDVVTVCLPNIPNEIGRASCRERV